MNKKKASFDSAFDFPSETRNSLGGRIRQLWLNSGEKQDDFVRELNVSTVTLANYMNDTRKPDSEFLLSLKNKLNISLDWLLTGVGTETPFSEEEKKESEVEFIPMVEARLSAGCGSLETSGESERGYAFRKDFLARKGNYKNMVLMRVSGNSMEPEIYNNDVVLIDQSKKDIFPGRIFAVGFEEAIYLKRIDMLPGKIVLKSSNPDYPPVELDVRGQCEEQFRVIGRVLWSGREYK